MSYTPFNPEIESHFLACLTQFPDIWGEVSLAKESDFSPIHRPIFSVIRQQLEAAQPVSTVILADKLKSYGVTAAHLADVEPYDYVWALGAKPVSKGDGVSLLKELKLITVRRDLIDRCKTAEKALKDTPAAAFDQMISIVDKTLTSVQTEYYTSSSTIDLFEDIIDVTETRGNNPVTADTIGYQGPFPSLNATLGNLVFPGSLTVLAARTGQSKSSLSFFYCTYIAERYDVPILWLDAAEMTVEQLQQRAICCFSQGRIPLWAVRSGEWRKHKEWTAIIRDEVWPKVKRIRFAYCNVGNMTPKDKISFIRRHYYNRVGRGNFLLIGDDYLKGIETFSANKAEHQTMGYFVGGIKSLITDEIQAGYWTSVQQNRMGITGGKKGDELEAADSANSVGISDRITQQATNAFAMRYKVSEELAVERNLLGNMVLKPIKTREAYGVDYMKILNQVKLPNGRFAANYYNLESQGFHFRDKGLMSDGLELMGRGIINTDMDGSKAITI